MSLDQSFVAEVAEWIALDPSPQDAALLQKCWMKVTKMIYVVASMVFSSLAPQGYGDR